MTDRIERAHERLYLQALNVAGVSGPSWSELTEEQRINIRNINDGHADWMRDFGKAIATGGPLPDPFME